MNERIKELVVKLVPDAFMTYKGYLYHSSDPKVFEHSDPEPLYTKQELVKFAELIVGECMRMCDVAAIGYESHGHMKEANGCYSAKEYIEEHFGVEE